MPPALPKITRYNLKSTLWTAPSMSIAVLSDFHAARPWMPLGAVEQVVAQVMATEPDLILLPGDFVVRGLLLSRPEPMSAIADRLALLSAPLGVYASLGNHDWKSDPLARRTRFAETSVPAALEAVGIPTLQNQSVALSNGAYLLGIDSQTGEGSTRRPVARHDLDLALKDVPKAASTILMAHEPDLFLDDPRPIALQVSGHTHAGQMRPFGLRLAAPSRHGGRLMHGLVSNGPRHLVVSAGLGFSTLPLRINAPSEIVVVQIGPSET